MKFRPVDPPRTFRVGLRENIVLKDCGALELGPDEQVTFIAPSGTQYDVARKSWGYYATPSLNDRLQRYRLRGVLVKSRIKRYYVLLVEQGKESEFQMYLDAEGLSVVTWLDTDAALDQIFQKPNS